MAHAELVGDRIEVITQWNERELVKQVPGTRWDATHKIWHCPQTWTSCVVLRGVFGDALTVGEDLMQWAWCEKEHVDQLLALRVLTEPTWQQVRTELYPFQEVGRNFLHDGREVLLGDEMGTGKTVQALAALDASPGAYPVLVVCPNSVKTHWANEVRRWTESTPYVVAGGATGRKKILAEAAKDPYAVIIVNFESVRLLSRSAPYGSVRLKRCRECDPRNGEEGLTPGRCQVHLKELNKITFKTVIIDEAHRIKDPQSQQTRAVWAVAHQPSVVNRWALTGTPIANHPGDLWSILHTISPRDFPTKTQYVNRYCLQSWAAWGGLSIVGLNPATRDEFFKIFDPRWRRMPKDLVLTQLPPKIRSVRWVEMGHAQAKNYRELENGLATMTSGGMLVAPNALIARLRQMQLASSAVKIDFGLNPSDLDGWVVRLCEPSPKLDELDAVLDELGDRKVAVCAESRQLIELAATRLQKRDISFGLITGTVNEYERDLALKNFQAGKLRALLFTIKAGGVGLTMTAADTMIFLQRSWSMIDNRQAEDRVHRIGSEVHESIHIIDIVTRDTLEERQIAVLTEKFMRLQEIARDRATLVAHPAPISYSQMRGHELDEEEAQILGMTL